MNEKILPNHDGPGGNKEGLIRLEQELRLLPAGEFRTLLRSMVIARHGKTRLNEEGRLQGSSDEELSELGRAEIELQAEALASVDHRLSLVVSSPMKRARQTAAIFATRLQLPLQIVSSLEEYGHGEWEGRLKADILADPANIAWTGQRISYELHHTSPPHQGESFFAFLERVNQALHQLWSIRQQQPANENRIAVVAHSEVTRAARFLYLLANEAGNDIRVADLQRFEEQFSFTPDGSFIQIPHGLVKLDLDNYSLQSME